MSDRARRHSVAPPRSVVVPRRCNRAPRRRKFAPWRQINQPDRVQRCASEVRRPTAQVQRRASEVDRWARCRGGVTLPLHPSPVYAPPPPRPALPLRRILPAPLAAGDAGA